MPNVAILESQWRSGYGAVNPKRPLTQVWSLTVLSLAGASPRIHFHHIQPSQLEPTVGAIGASRDDQPDSGLRV